MSAPDIAPKKIDSNKNNGREGQKQSKINISDFEVIVRRARPSRWFIVLIIVVSIGLATTGYFTITSEYVAVNRNVIVHDGKDVKIALTIEDHMQIPLQTFIDHKDSEIRADLYFKSSPVFLEDVKLSSNGSSILTIKSEGIREPSEQRPGVYKANVETGHPLEVSSLNEKYFVNVLYRKDNTSSPVLVEAVPFVWNISTLDFGKPSYFWIIFLGVLISRVFSFSQGTSGPASTEFSSRELLWVPFSAIITLLIFSSFREQVQLTSDVMTNLALAFGFGFGFDKVFEVWHKSPSKQEPKEQKYYLQRSS